jgi:hypothetical protein
MANRTLQFHGYAYGSEPVQLNAHINGEVVFSGPVTTVDQPLPVNTPVDTASAPVLFSIENSPLFPTDFSGSYPMTISVATGSGIVVGRVRCNYMLTGNNSPAFESTDSTVTGNILTIGTLVSGTVAVGQYVIPPHLYIESGSGSEWTLNGTVDVPVGPTAIIGSIDTKIPGNETIFSPCYLDDPRSNVSIDGIPKDPTRSGANGTWCWIVQQGSTLSCDFSVSLGNVA